MSYAPFFKFAAQPLRPGGLSFKTDYLLFKFPPGEPCVSRAALTKSLPSTVVFLAEPFGMRELSFARAPGTPARISESIAGIAG